MAMGRWMAENGAILQEERFTWTARGSEFVHGPWGFSWLSWTLHKHTGLFGLRLFNGLCATGALLLLHQAAKNRQARPKAIAFAMFFAAAMLIQNLGFAHVGVSPVRSAGLGPLKPRSMGFMLPLFASTGRLVQPSRLFSRRDCAVGRHDSAAPSTAARGRLCYMLLSLPAPLFSDGSGSQWTHNLDRARQLLLAQSPRAPEWGGGMVGFSAWRIGFDLFLWACLFLKGPNNSPGNRVSACFVLGLAITGGRFIAWFGLAGRYRWPADSTHNGFQSRHEAKPIPESRVGFGIFWAVILLKTCGQNY